MADAPDAGPPAGAWRRFGASRRLRIALFVCIAVAVLIGAALWALPHVVRRVAVDRITEQTGRATSIERVEINVFTGRFAVDRFRMAGAGDRPEAFVEFDRLEGRLAIPALFRFDVRLAELRLRRPTVRVARTGPAAFDFDDVRARLASAEEPEPEPSRFTASVERLEVEDGTVVVEDAVVTPAVVWRVDDLDVEGSGFTTRPGEPPAALRLTARVGDAPLEVSSSSIALEPVEVAMDVRLGPFDIAQARPYLPPHAAATPTAGALTASLRIERLRPGDFADAALSGEIGLEKVSAVLRGADDPFFHLGGLRVAIDRMDLLGRDVAIEAVELDGLDVKVVRDAQGDIDVVKALSAPPGDSAAPVETDAPAPARAAADAPPASGDPQSDAAQRRVTIKRVALASGTVTLTDEAVSPRREWKVEGLSVDGAGISTAPDAPPGTLKAQARVVADSGGGKPATLTADVRSLRVTPLELTGRIAIDGVRLAAVRAYWPDSAPAVVSDGTVAAAVDVALGQDGDGRLTQASASGDIRMEKLRVERPGQPAPFLTVPNLAVGIRQVDAVARNVHVASVRVNGANVRAVREPDGQIDLLALAGGGEPAEAGPPPAAAARAAPAAGPPVAAQAAWGVRLERFALAGASVEFEDRAVSPATTLKLSDLSLDATRLAWPLTRPATFAFSASMPGGGRTDGKGTATLEPLALQVALSTRDAPITPYQAYFPFEAQLFGLLNGDSLNEIQRSASGELIIASRGTAWATDLGVRDPKTGEAVVHADGMEIRDIDFSWPNYALVSRIAFIRPRAHIERDADGVINLRALFAPREGPSGEAAAPAADAAASDQTSGGGGDSGGGPLQTMVIDLHEIAVEDGAARFVDQTTTPPFTEDVSRIAMLVRGLSNDMTRPERTTLTLEALLGSDGVLDMRGDLSGLGEELRADLVAEIRDFALPKASPYAENLTSWAVHRGTLQAKIHYQIEGDRLTAQHDLEFKKLQVKKAADADRAKQRIGVPLGLAVALLKDTNGNIDFSLPLTGTLSDRNFNWAEMMWAGVKQVIAKVLLSPFRAIGRLVTGGEGAVEGLEMNPVTFAAGSAVIAPSLEAQLERVAEFLRRSPQIRVTLTPVVTAADIEALKAQEISARVEALRRERGLPHLAAAFRAYFEQALPGVEVPKTIEEQLAALVPKEPVPQARLDELIQRRIAATRDSLVVARGIAADRVTTAATPEAAPAKDGQGRVELAIEAAE